MLKKLKETINEFVYNRKLREYDKAIQYAVTEKEIQQIRTNKQKFMQEHTMKEEQAKKKAYELEEKAKLKGTRLTLKKKPQEQPQQEEKEEVMSNEQEEQPQKATSEPALNNHEEEPLMHEQQPPHNAGEVTLELTTKLGIYQLKTTIEEAEDLIDRIQNTVNKAVTLQAFAFLDINGAYVNPLIIDAINYTSEEELIASKKHYEEIVIPQRQEQLRKLHQARQEEQQRLHQQQMQQQAQKQTQQGPQQPRPWQPRR